MTRFQEKSFTVPVSTPTKTLCAVHHIVNGKCLRCPHVVKEIIDRVVVWDGTASDPRDTITR